MKCDLTENLSLKANAQVIMLATTSTCPSILLILCRGIILFLISYWSNCFVFFLQLTNEPHMSHGMANFDYKVNRFYSLTSLCIYMFLIDNIYVY